MRPCSIRTTGAPRAAACGRNREPARACADDTEVRRQRRGAHGCCFAFTYLTTTGTSANSPRMMKPATSRGVASACTSKPEMAVEASGRETRLIGGALGIDHGVEAGAEEGENEAARNDAQRRCRNEQGRTNAGERRHQIDEPERNERHEPQEQQIAERVLTKTHHQLVDGRPGATDQDFADGPARDQKDDGAADRRTDHRAERAHKGAEQNTAGDGEHERARDRKRNDRDVEQHIGREGRTTVLGNDPLNRGVVSHQQLERELAIEPQGKNEDQPRHHDRERQEAPRAKRTNQWLRMLAGFGGH